MPMFVNAVLMLVGLGVHSATVPKVMCDMPRTYYPAYPVHAPLDGPLPEPELRDFLNFCRSSTARSALKQLSEIALAEGVEVRQQRSLAPLPRKVQEV